MLFIILMCLVAYMTAGVTYARKAYALQQHEIKAAAPMINRKTELVSEIDSMHHGGDCNLSYSSLKFKGCDCHHRTRMLKFSAEKNKIEKVLPPEHDVWTLAAFWPLHSTTNFMKSGTVKKPDYNYIAELEKANGIGEL